MFLIFQKFQISWDIFLKEIFRNRTFLYFLIKCNVSHIHSQQFCTSHTSTSVSSWEKLLLWIHSWLFFVPLTWAPWSRDQSSRNERQKANLIDWSESLSHPDNHALFPTALQWYHMPPAIKYQKSPPPQHECSTLHHWLFRTEPRDTNLSVNSSHDRPNYNAVFWVMCTIHTFFLFCYT